MLIKLEKSGHVINTQAVKFLCAEQIQKGRDYAKKYEVAFLVRATGDILKVIVEKEDVKQLVEKLEKN